MTPGAASRSKTHGRGHTVPDFADFVASFSNEMELPRIALVGASLGAPVAADFACRHPDRVEQLVLVGPAGVSPWDPDQPQMTRNSGNEARK